MTYQLTIRNITTIITTVIISIILLATGLLVQKRDCQDGSALPDNWQQDLTYQKPYHSDTIDFRWTFIFATLLVVLLAAKSTQYVRNKSWNAFTKYSITVLVFYLVGAGISNGIVDILKGQLCSLRPSAALRPDHGDSYLSTPSGHANMAVYTAIYVSYWYLKHISDPVLQVGFCMLMSIFPFIVAATRITDNRHWPVDVMAGSIIGIVVACTLFYVIESADMEEDEAVS